MNKRSTEFSVLNQFYEFFVPILQNKLFNQQTKQVVYKNKSEINYKT